MNDFFVTGLVATIIFRCVAHLYCRNSIHHFASPRLRFKVSESGRAGSFSSCNLSALNCPECSPHQSIMLISFRLVLSTKVLTASGAYQRRLAAHPLHASPVLLSASGLVPAAPSANPSTCPAALPFTPSQQVPASEFVPRPPRSQQSGSRPASEAEENSCAGLPPARCLLLMVGRGMPALVLLSA